MKEIEDEIVSTFKGLTDKRRLEILSILSKGEKCACHILERTNLTQSQLSYHCKILCESKLVKCRPEGKWCHYSLNLAGIERAKELLDTFTNDSKENEICGECKRK